MAATLDKTTVFDAAVGNTIVLMGSGLSAGAGAKVELTGQGADGSVTTTVSGAVFAGTSVTFVLPDGALSGAIKVTASDLSTATRPINVVSQYVQASEYIGEGVDVSTDFAPGELDAILQNASAMADSWIGGPLRVFQSLEEHRWKGGTRIIWPFRNPIVSIDGLRVRISNEQFADFHTEDVVVNVTDCYGEILSYAMLSYTLLGAIETLGLSANIILLTYTAGWPQNKYPQTLKQAVRIIASSFAESRAARKAGFSGFDSATRGRQTFKRKTPIGLVETQTGIPAAAMALLRPHVSLRIA